MTVTPQMLRAIPALGKLSAGTLERLAQVASVVSLQRGEVLFRHGDPPSGLYALLDGYVKLYRQSNDRAQILFVLQTGECFGATSLPDGSPCPCTAQAITPAQAIYIAPTALSQLFETNTDLLVALLELVSSRVKQLAGLVHDLAFRDVATRLARVLLARAEAEGRLAEDGLHIQRILSQQEMAAMVGTSREVVYRACKQFERQGLLHLSRREIVILDPARLSEIASQETR